MATPAGERRYVAALIADVADSTAIGERLGPERSKFLFDEVVRLMGDEIRRFGGTVAQLIGDGLLALFGAPVAHEDDSLRAVRAAIAIHEALARYAGEVEEAYGIRLAARVAVNTGPVVLVPAGVPDEVRYNALGDTVNVAARLQALAGEGGLAVGSATARQIERTFALEPLGDVELKGKSVAVAAFRVVGELAGEGATAETPLVGREPDLAALVRVLEELVDGRGAIVSLTGEAGIGKTRLVAEACRRVEGVRYLEGHGVSYAEAIPYWPARELVRSWLGLGSTEPEARVRLELKAGLAEVLDDESEEVYPFLATLLGTTLEPEATERLRQLSRDSVRQQTIDGVRRLACALAAQRPLCLVLEDLHWADDATLDLLDELLGATEEEAIALLLVYRSERDHRSWELGQRARRRYPHRYRELELEPLDPDASRTLAANAAGAELPEAVGELIADRAGGNPFFLEEALRDLVERGALRRENGRYELAVGVDRLAIPALVQEALQARLDRLAPETREVVNVAAVVGRTFGLRLLERVAPRERLGSALSELQRLDLVVEERRRPTPEYRFRHGLVQDVAYNSLLEPRRRDLHRSVGAALEELHEASPAEAYGLLAWHFTEADAPEAAADYLLKAGDAARAVHANNEALEHYSRALPFLARNGDGGRARSTLLKIALMHHLRFDFEQAGRAYDLSFTHADEERGLVPRERLEVLFAKPWDFVPGYAYVTHTIWFATHLFRGLLRLDSELNLVPDLAERLAVSPDGRTYRFRLRPDACWSDGVPVSADDFVYGWRRSHEEKTPPSHLLGEVEAATALDPATLEIVLREPRSFFPYLLAGPWCFPWPRHRCEALGDAWREPANLVGNGPFVLAEFDEAHALLTASPRWSGPRGNVREAWFRFGSIEERIDAWRGGSGDLLWWTGGADLADVPNSVADSSAGLATHYVAYRRDRPPFDSEVVRRAFAHALDRDRVPPGAEPIVEPSGRGGLLPPPMPGHSHRIALTHDPELARSLLADAGYPEGAGLPEIELAGGS